MLTDVGLLKGLNTFNGHITYAAVAESQDREFRDPRELLA